MNMHEINLKRRQLIKTGIGFSSLAVFPLDILRAQVAQSREFGDGKLHILSDGTLELPRSAFVPDSLSTETLSELFERFNMTGEQISQDCNITLWESANHKVLFDVGAGPNFMPSAGKLLDAFAELDIDPADITDVVFTHAHPDHLWGLLDDFDELICTNAQYHIAESEWDYWLHTDTLNKTPEAFQSFVVGAQNRLPLLEDSISFFKPGQEILPGIEAIDTAGHTPGHTSFALHSANEQITILGDTLINVVMSFASPNTPNMTDVDPDLAVQTRLQLLDRLANENSAIIGFHLPHPGIGFVEKSDNTYRFVADS